MNNQEYDIARGFIKRRFSDLKTKIISNFKEGFVKKDIIVINVHLMKFRMFFRIVKSMS
jgi:hypothetical protein